MGYFSELDYVQHEEMEWSNPTTVQRLADRIDCLNESLNDLVDRCPHDMCDPGFDRMFYSECLSEVCDNVSTMQGLLQEIRKTEELLLIAEQEERRETEEQRERMKWRSTVLETGATPDYQVVLLSAFFPAADPSVAA